MFTFRKSKKSLWIFLDVDGVLNRRNNWAKPFTLNPQNISVFRELLSILGTSYKYSIILTSSWRKGWCPRQQPPHLSALCDAVPIAHTLPLALADTDRGKGILTYMKQYNYTGARLTLDDDETLFRVEEREAINLYTINYLTGFQKDDIPKVRHLL